MLALGSHPGEEHFFQHDTPTSRPKNLRLVRQVRGRRPLGILVDILFGFSLGFLFSGIFARVDYATTPIYNAALRIEVSTDPQGLAVQYMYVTLHDWP